MALLNVLQFPLESNACMPAPTANDWRYGYALRVVNDEMSPRFRRGEWLHVDHNVEPLPGDDVVVQTSDGRVLVKTLESRDKNTLVLSCYNAAYDKIFVDTRKIEFIHCVAGIYAAHGFDTRIGPKITSSERRAFQRSASSRGAVTLVLAE